MGRAGNDINNLRTLAYLPRTLSQLEVHVAGHDRRTILRPRLDANPLARPWHLDSRFRGYFVAYPISLKARDGVDVAPHAEPYLTTPAAGLDAVAYNFFSMRPARNAFRPASTAARIASAISTASCAPAIAVFISTPSAPSSIAIAASDAVPTPASTINGTSVIRSRKMRRFAKF